MVLKIKDGLHGFQLPRILKKLQFGNGKQVRDILFITDLCNLYYKIASSKKKFINECIFNVGGGHKFSLSILELLNILKKKTKQTLR